MPPLYKLPSSGMLSIFWSSQLKKPETVSFALLNAPTMLSLMPPNVSLTLSQSCPAYCLILSQFLYSATPAATTAPNPKTIQPIGVAPKAAFSAHCAAVNAVVAPVAIPVAAALARCPALFTAIIALLCPPAAATETNTAAS